MKTIKPWQCETGDVVEFHFSEWAKVQEKAPLKGVIISRACKLAEIKIENSTQIVTVHVSLVNVLKPVPRIKVLTRKFEEKPSNKKGENSKKEVTHKVGEMTFKYKKK
jgi:hypothetical protein